MKTKTLISLFLILSVAVVYSQSQNNGLVEISGKVTDFEGNPIDSAVVELLHADFSRAYSTYSDNQGNYKLEGVKKGKYLAMYVLRPNEYPRKDAVPKKDMRLEFWAWNVIADRDLTINPRYHRLELYGLNAFMPIGSGAGIWLYARPMSLGKLLEYDSEIYTDKSKIDEIVDINVYPEYFKAEAFVDDKPVPIKSIQKVVEIEGTENKAPMIGYLINIDFNITERPMKPFKIKLVGENTELNEKGENVCFFNLSDYK